MVGRAARPPARRRCLLELPPVCGIGGIATTRGTADLRSALEPVIRRLAHRGPDDEGIHVAESGGTRVALVRDSPGDPRPLRARAPADGVDAVRLHDRLQRRALQRRRGLRRELAAAGHEFAGMSDTEVALAAYDEWGADAFARLRGMFALAIWDPRDAVRPARARPARDQAPVLRTAARAGSRSRRSCARSSRRWTDRPASRVAALDGYLAEGAPPEPHTMLQDVWMLPPGSTLRFASGEARQSPFWSLEDQFAAERLDIGAEEASERIRAELERAVREQLVSDVPVGVFLSGGIDSSALVGLSATVDRPPTTTSVVFAEPRVLRGALHRCGVNGAGRRTTGRSS